MTQLILIIAATVVLLISLISLILKRKDILYQVLGIVISSSVFFVICVYSEMQLMENQQKTELEPKEMFSNTLRSYIEKYNLIDSLGQDPKKWEQYIMEKSKSEGLFVTCFNDSLLRVGTPIIPIDYVRGVSEPEEFNPKYEDILQYANMIGGEKAIVLSSGNRSRFRFGLHEIYRNSKGEHYLIKFYNKESIRLYFEDDISSLLSDINRAKLTHEFEEFDVREELRKRDSLKYVGVNFIPTKEPYTFDELWELTPTKELIISDDLFFDSFQAYPRKSKVFKYNEYPADVTSNGLEICQGDGRCIKVRPVHQETYDDYLRSYYHNFD